MQNTEKKPVLWKIILLVVLLAAMIVLLDWMHLRHDAKQHYMELNSAASAVFFSAESYRKEGHTAAELAGSGRISGQEGFSGYLLARSGKYLAEGDYYAIVCNDSGQIQYVLYSRSKIADKYVTDPPRAGDGEDKDSMLRLLQTPVLWRTAVGVYYPAVISAAPETATESETK